MAPKTPTVELTDAEKSELVGGPYGEAFPIPSEAQFDAVGLGRLDAPELEVIGRRLIDRHFSIPLGHLRSRRILYLWSKSGSSEGGKPKWGSVTLAGADMKHLSLEPIESGDFGNPVDAVVRMAADHLRDAHATRWQVGNELCFLLFRIGVYTTQNGDERLRMVPPDSAFFTPQMRLFGPQTPELKKTILDIRQTRFDWADRLADDIAKAEAAKDFDPSVDLPAGVASEAGPVEGGAPEADWAELDREGMAAFADRYETTGEDDDDALEIRRGRMRANFNTGIRLDDGIEFCEACGLDIDDHDPEVCQGGTPETRQDAQKNSRKMPTRRARRSDVSDAATGAPPVLGDRSASNGNGAHDKDDVAGILWEPDAAMAGRL